MQANQTQGGLASVPDPKCKACVGLGWQLSALDGLRHVCPSCDGTGNYIPRQAQPVWIYPPVIYPQPIYPQPWWDTGKVWCAQSTCQDRQGATGGVPINKPTSATFGMIS